MSVEIKGLDSLRRKLQSLGGELEQATEKGVEKATKTVQTAAKLLCPVDTGYLRESIRQILRGSPQVNTSVQSERSWNTPRMSSSAPARWALRLRPHRRHPLVWVIVRTGKASSHSRTSIPHWSITVTAS